MASEIDIQSNTIETYFAPLGIKPIEVFRFGNEVYVRGITKLGNKVLILIDEDKDQILANEHISIDMDEITQEDYKPPIDCESCLDKCSDCFLGLMIRDNDNIWCRVNRCQGRFTMKTFTKTDSKKLFEIFDDDLLPYPIVRYSFLVRNVDKAHKLIRKGTREVARKTINKTVSQLKNICALLNRNAALACRYHQRLEEVLHNLTIDIDRLETVESTFEGSKPTESNLKKLGALWENILYRRIVEGQIIDGAHKVIYNVDAYEKIMLMLARETAQLNKASRVIGEMVEFKYVSFEQLVEASMSEVPESVVLESMSQKRTVEETPTMTITPAATISRIKSPSRSVKPIAPAHTTVHTPVRSLSPVQPVQTSPVRSQRTVQMSPSQKDRPVIVPMQKAKTTSDAPVQVRREPPEPSMSIDEVPVP